MQPRIFHSAPLKEGTDVTITGGGAAHLGKVLRLRERDTVILFNGEGLDHIGQIISVGRDKVAIAILTSQATQTESPLAVTLMQGICRNHRMDLLIQKSTELGVNDIRPIICERSVVKIGDDRAGKKIGHWRSVAISATEQCGRSEVPAIAAPENLSNALSRLASDTARLMLDPKGTDTLESAIGEARSITLLIGPEGGLSDPERASAIDAGFKSVHLGPRILRTETAPIAALSIIQYLRGDLADN
jgi:16S rRNA (uracil1498-N3)-methyltransferase